MLDYYNPYEVLKPLDDKNESSLRIQLAAVCHLLEYYGWSDAILNHVTARLPENQNQFLMNPFGLMYQEITASNLVKLDLNGSKIGDNSWPVNKPGFILHSAIYEYRPDINCVIHTHTPYGVAISMLEKGLICSDQMAMLFHDSVGYHDFEGVVIDEDEKTRIARDLGLNKSLILRNHGLVATGRTIAEAFWNYYYLEFACKTQIIALSSGMQINQVPENIKSLSFKQHEYFCKDKAPTEENTFPGNFEVMLLALMRMLDRKGSIYKD